MMDRKGISQIVVMMAVMAVVAFVLLYSLRVVPEEMARQRGCEAHAGFCHDEPTCPSGTNRIDYDCANDRPCCIGIVQESTSQPAQESAAPAALISHQQEARQHVEQLQERLTAARGEGNLGRISEEYLVAKQLIINRFDWYQPPIGEQMTRQNNPFDYNTVKSFEQLTLAQEAAFRTASDERKRYASSQDYFRWMCRDWLFLTRAYLLGYYEESTYDLDILLQNKQRVFRDYADFIGTSRSCEAMRLVMSTDDFMFCRENWADEEFRSAALGQETPNEEVWGSCYMFRDILGHYPLMDFERADFSIEGTTFFLPATPHQIFSEALS